MISLTNPKALPLFLASLPPASFLQSFPRTQLPQEPTMKKVVVKVDIHDDRMKQKIMRAVSILPGIDSISVDMKESKLTVVGNVDPIEVVAKLKKHCHNQILTVGPAVDPKKAGDEKKSDPAKKDEEKKKDSNQQQQEQFQHYMGAYNYNHHPYMAAAQPVPHHLNYGYRVVSPDENPNSCVIS